MAGKIDPTGRRKHALDEFLESSLRSGFEIETHIMRSSLARRADVPPESASRRAAPSRYVVSVDERGKMTMLPAGPKRS
jgi:hypothetical protein